MYLLTNAENGPFVIAAIVLAAIVAIEVVSLVFGANASGLIDSMLPDAMLDSLESGWLGWLHLGKVPILILLVLFLGTFSLAGFLLQRLALATIGFSLPAGLAVLPALVVAVSGVRIGGRALGKWVPRLETSAVSSASLIGRVATISNGTARRGMAAEAKVLDEHGNPLFVLIEPDDDGVTFIKGQRVLLVTQVSGQSFRAILNPNPNL